MRTRKDSADIASRFLIFMAKDKSTQDAVQNIIRHSGGRAQIDALVDLINAKIGPDPKFSTAELPIFDEVVRTAYEEMPPATYALGPAYHTNPIEDEEKDQ
jgi:hypothetical protein